LREALAYLGADYTAKIIDKELCLYRNLNNGCDIEISGLRVGGQRGKICNFICVWAWPGINNERVALEYIRNYRASPISSESAKLDTLADLKRELDALVTKYRTLPIGGETL